MDVVSSAVAAGGVGWGPGLQEMVIELIRGDGGQAAGAGELVSLLVDLAVISAQIRRLEDVQQVIDDRFIGEFREATGAPHGNRVGILA